MKKWHAILYIFLNGKWTEPNSKTLLKSIFSLFSSFHSSFDRHRACTPAHNTQDNSRAAKAHLSLPIPITKEQRANSETRRSRSRFEWHRNSLLRCIFHTKTVEKRFKEEDCLLGIFIVKCGWTKPTEKRPKYMPEITTPSPPTTTTSCLACTGEMIKDSRTFFSCYFGFSKSGISHNKLVWNFTPPRMFSFLCDDRRHRLSFFMEMKIISI